MPLSLPLPHHVGIIYLALSPLIARVNLENRDQIVLLYAPPVWLAEDRKREAREGGRKKERNCNSLSLQRRAIKMG